MTDEKIIQITEQDIDFPVVEVLTGRLFLTGKSDSGKSNTISVVFEELLEQGYPFLVVDTEGEYYGLKEDYEVLHVGADEECDLQVGPEHAEKIAELCLEQNVPVILDISGYIEKDVAEEIVTETLEKLYHKEKKQKMPFLCFIEEGHEFVPESGYQKKANYPGCSGIITRIASRGRKRGLGIGLASQRPAKIDKDYITQCNWRGWHKLDWSNDRGVANDVLGDYVVREDEVKELREKLEDPGLETGDTVKYGELISTLQPGEAVLEADFLETEKQRVKFRRKKTFDAGATPDLDDFERPELKSVSGELVDELQEITEQKKREKNRIAQLEQTVEEKNEEIEELQDEVEAAEQNNKTVNRLADQLADIASEGSGEGREALQEIREEKDSRIRELENRKQELEDEVQEVRESRQQLQQRVEELEEYEQAVEHMDELREGVKRMSEALGLDIGEGDERLRQKLQKKEEQIDELQTQVSELKKQGYSLDEEFEEKMDFLKHEAVCTEIEKAADKTSVKSDHVWDVLSVLVDQEELTNDDIVPYVEISKSSIKNVLPRLVEHNVVKQSKDGKKHIYSLNAEGMKEIVQMQKKRSEMAELKNEVKS